jgi:hypothetical protein
VAIFGLLIGRRFAGVLDSMESADLGRLLTASFLIPYLISDLISIFIIIFPFFFKRLSVGIGINKASLKTSSAVFLTNQISINQIQIFAK